MAGKKQPHPDEVWLLVARTAIQTKMPFDQCLEFADKMRVEYRKRFYPQQTPEERVKSAKDAKEVKV